METKNIILVLIAILIVGGLFFSPEKSGKVISESSLSETIAVQGGCLPPPAPICSLSILHKLICDDKEWDNRDFCNGIPPGEFGTCGTSPPRPWGCEGSLYTDQAEYCDWWAHMEKLTCYNAYTECVEQPCKGSHSGTVGNKPIYVY